MDSQVIKRFQELVTAGTIREELKKQASMNWRWKPVNGHVFWRDIVSCRGWVIQQHVGPVYGPYDHYRVLDPAGVRCAFGTSEVLSKRIMGIPINKLTEKVTRLRDRLSGKKVQTAPACDEQVFAEFRRLIDSGEIRSRLSYQASANIEDGTFGGKVFWDDLCSHRGWRIQQNRIFRNCRIIDPCDIRLACGIKSWLFRRIMGQPVNYLVGYLNSPHSPEEHLMNYPAENSGSKGVVVLIHGWGCQAKHMEYQAQCLNTFGYDVLCYDYRSSRQSIPDLAEELLETLAAVVRKTGRKKLYLLTHSMGGLLVRKMLELDRSGRVSPAISQIVMMGPPNQGSKMADAAVLSGIGWFNKSINDMRFFKSSAAVHQIGVPAHYRKKFGIIAGSRDFKVLPQYSVEIPGMTKGTDYELIKVSASHPGLKRSYEALSNAVYFFEHGTFPRTFF